MKAGESAESGEPTTSLLRYVLVRRAVPPSEIGRYYLRAELPNVLAADPETAAGLAETVESAVAALPDDVLWRLVEAMSFRFRANRVFGLLTDAGIDWQEVRLPLDAVTMTGVMPHIDDIVYSDRIDRNPVTFAAFLRDYYAKHGDYDPAGLNLFRPLGLPIPLDAILVESENDRPALLDGTFRVVEMAQAGVASVRAYWAVPNGRPHRQMAGDSAFIQLRDLYARHRGRPDAQAVLSTARLLAVDSRDGLRALRTYWVDHPRDADIKHAGTDLLKHVPPSPVPPSPH